MNKSKTIINFISNSDWTTKRKSIWILYLIIKDTLLVKLVPVKYYYHRYFYNNTLDNDPTITYQTEIKLIKSVISNMPWKITCLMESLIVRDYFTQYNIYLPICLGVQKSYKLEAHAWYENSNINGFNRLIYQDQHNEK